MLLPGVSALADLALRFVGRDNWVSCFTHVVFTFLAKCP
jgi:hypothetical protein